jgi:PKD repeat protein
MTWRYEALMMLKTRVFLLSMLATLALTTLAHANENGRTGYSGDPAIRGGASCETCHTGGIAPTVDLTGPMTVTPGSTSTYTFTISGGQEVSGGLDVSATAGMLSVNDGGTKLSGGEIVQNAARPADGNGDVVFTFDWTAPVSPGTAALYAAGLSANGDGRDSGDETGRIALMISVESAPPPNVPPVADPGGPYSGMVGAAISFDGSGSYDSDGTIASYAWDFGDGVGVGTGAMPSYTYAADGNYTVTLTVTDDDGATGEMTTVANVSTSPPQNQPPIASAGGPYSELVGSPITFDGSGSSDPDGTIMSYAWDFGDGSNGSGVTATHAYAAAGSYQAMLTVTDDQGASASDPASAVVTDQRTSSLMVLLRAPRRVMVSSDGDGKEVKVAVAVDTSSLPDGTMGCGTATLFKDGQSVGTQTFCMRDDDGDDGDEVDEDDEDDDDEAESSSRSSRELRVKTASGVVALSRPTRGSWVRVSFPDISVGMVDAPSITWTAVADLMGRTGEAAPVTTQIQERRRR